jgi:hypothetical protein
MYVLFCDREEYLTVIENISFHAMQQRPEAHANVIARRAQEGFVMQGGMCEGTLFIWPAPQSLLAGRIPELRVCAPVGIQLIIAPQIEHRDLVQGDRWTVLRFDGPTDMTMPEEACHMEVDRTKDATGVTRRPGSSTYAPGRDFGKDDSSAQQR